MTLKDNWGIRFFLAFTLAIFLLPFSLFLETPWHSSPTLTSTLSLMYLGVIATGLAWLIRFRILSVNGLVFQTQDKEGNDIDSIFKRSDFEKKFFSADTNKMFCKIFMEHAKKDPVSLLKVDAAQFFKAVDLNRGM